MEEKLVGVLREVSGELERLLSSKTVVGQPIVVGDATVIPLLSVGFGMGVAAGTGTDKKNGQGGGTGLGTGGGIKPIALLISDKNGVRVESIRGSTASALESVVGKVAQVMKDKAGDSAQPGEGAED